MRHVYWLVFILVAACGDDPEIDFTATVMPVSTPEDTPANFAIDANLPANFQLTTAPTHGTVTGAGTAWTYTPEANYFGADTLTITATEGTTVIELPVAIAVTAVNDAPVAESDSFATNADNALPIDVATLLANDTDLEGDTLTITAASSAVSGGVVLAGDTITFTPTTGFAGTATFEYTLSDGTDTATGTVTVAVGVAQAITANDDTASTDEDVAFSIPIATLLANDIDPDGHTLSITDLQNAVNCTAVKVGTEISVTPTPDANGQATFEYVLTDGALTDTATVTITINAIADAPVANADDATTAEDTPIQIPAATLLANDTDADNDTLTVTSVTGTGATLASNTITFAPAADFNGNATFQYTISDGNGGTSTGTVTVAVTPVADAPVANPDAMTIAEDGVASVDVLANDTDADGDTIIVASFTQPAHGVVNFTGGVATYTPAGNFTGPDAFTYTLDDGTGGTATGTVSITVTPVNDAPVAADDSINVAEETPTVVPAAANDSDVDGDVLVVSVVTQPLHGTVQLAGGVVTYTPAVNYVGPDGFDYTVSDGNTGTDVGRVTINVTNVNDAPVANADVLGTDENTVVTGNVVANDTDVDGDTLTVQSNTQGAHGTVSFSGNVATYTPATDFSGEDAFTYTISDGKGGTATGTVTVFVGLDNDPPVAVDDTVTVVEETPTPIDVLGNDSDIDLNPLVVSAVTSADHGIVSLVGGVVTYTPNDNYFGPDGFDYVVSDGLGGSDIGHVTITVTNVNDTPVAVNDTLTTNEDSLATLNVTLNDTDIDGDTLAIQSSTQPAHGTLVFTATLARYTPALNYNGPDSFTYTVTDGNGGTATATVSVTVNPVNDAPVAGDDARNVVEDTATVFSTLLGNDNDVDGDALGITGVGTAAHGTLALNTANNTVTYTPATNYFGPDAFNYTISDGNGGVDIGRVNITVTNVNDAPVAVNDALSTNEDTAKALNVVTNDTDVDNDTLSLDSITQPATGGSVSSTGNTITFTPTANFNGSTSFTYVVRDPSNATSTGTVNVTVVAVNDAPVAVGDDITTNEDTQSGVVTLTTNDTDVDTGQTLSVTATTDPANGTVARTGNNVRYTPNPNFNGTDIFSYTVSDGNGGTDTGTITVTVNPVNDAPDAANDIATVAEDASDTVIDVKSNDDDIDGDALTVTAVTQPANGTATLSSGVVSFQPTANFNGVTTFSYTVSDNNGGTDTATVTVTVTPVNDPPNAVDDVATVAEDANDTVINVKGNDTDLDAGTTLTVTAVTQPANGTVTLTSGVVSFKPALNFSGTTTFGYTLSDNAGGTDTATVTVTVTPVNDLPIAVNDTPTVAEDSTNNLIDVLANDSDVEGAVTVTAVTQPANGSVTLTAGVVRFTPTANFSGSTTFGYTITDSNNATANATVAVTVTPVNDAPSATNDALTTNEDTPGNVDLSNNVSDPDTGQTLTITASNGTNGSVSINGLIATYTPNPNFNGGDSFSYTVSDGNGGTDTATVTVTVTPVNDAPVAGNDTLTVAEDTLGTVNLFANDSDADGDPLVIQSNTNPANGSVSIANGVATFTPAPNFSGSTSFTYLLTGGAASATVSITVSPVNDPPVANNVVSSTTPGTPVTITLSGSDIDSSSLTFAIVSNPIGGSLGPITPASSTTATVVYNPGIFTGSTTFTYEVKDDAGATSLTKVVSISVAGCGDSNLDTGEECDDGNQVPNDGCEPVTCTLTCGSGTDPQGITVDAAGNCFAAYEDELLTHAGAIGICIERGGHLATVLGPDENAAVLEAASFLTDEVGWIGATDVPDEVFRWVTTEPFSFTAFEDGQPDGGQEQNCLATTTNGWFDESCGASLGYICEFNDKIGTGECGDGILDPEEECDNPNPGEGCEPDCTFSCATGSGAVAVTVDAETGNCFAAFEFGLNNRISRGQAIEFCASEQIDADHLATAITENEALKVKEAASALSERAWIGGEDLEGEDNFVWITDETPFDRADFAADQPNGGDTENCVAATSGGWFDEDCDRPLNVICEFEKAVVVNQLQVFQPGSAAAIMIENLTRHGTLTEPGR